MESVAQTASQHLAATGCITVVVQDNGPIHTSSKVQQRWAEWEKKGLLLLLFTQILFRDEPANRWSGSNLIRHELAGQMFEDELDLAYAVMDGVEARGQQGKYTTERFKFNSVSSP